MAIFPKNNAIHHSKRKQYSTTQSHQAKEFSPLWIVAPLGRKSLNQILTKPKNIIHQKKKNHDQFWDDEYHHNIHHKRNFGGIWFDNSQIENSCINQGVNHHISSSDKRVLSQTLNSLINIHF